MKLFEAAIGTGTVTVTALELCIETMRHKELFLFSNLENKKKTKVFLLMLYEYYNLFQVT